MIDWDKLLIERYINDGLSNQQAEYLVKSLKNNEAFSGDEYAQALLRKTRKVSGAQDKINSDEFMKNFRDSSSKDMTTDEFFDPPKKGADPFGLDRPYTPVTESDIPFNPDWSEIQKARVLKSLNAQKEHKEYSNYDKPIHPDSESTDPTSAYYDRKITAEDYIPEHYDINEYENYWRDVGKESSYNDRPGWKEWRSSSAYEHGPLVNGAEALLPVAIHYANQATHGEFNPLDIKSAGEGSEVETNHEQPYNSLKELYRQKQLKSLTP